MGRVVRLPEQVDNCGGLWWCAHQWVPTTPPPQSPPRPAGHPGMWPTLRLDLDLARFGFPVVFGFYIWPASVFKKPDLDIIDH